MKALAFRPHERLKRPADFLRARRQGKRRAGRWLVLWAFQGPGRAARACRLGVAVARVNGIAARRNLFKRRVREFFRLNKNRWPRGWDVVVSPKAGALAPDKFPAGFEDMKADFLRLTDDLLGSGAPSTSFRAPPPPL